MDFDYLKISVTIALSVLGWLTVSYLNARRDQYAKRRDITLEHQINAYRTLTQVVSHREQNEEQIRALENLLSDVQLFGSIEQVDLAKKLIDDFVRDREFELDPLINSLRSDLREQLGISRVVGNVRWLRWSE